MNEHLSTAMQPGCRQPALIVQSVAPLHAGSPFHPETKWNRNGQQRPASQAHELGATGTGLSGSANEGSTIPEFEPIKRSRRISKRLNGRAMLLGPSEHGGMESSIDGSSPPVDRRRNGGHLLLLFIIFSLWAPAVAEEIPTTLMATPGRLLVKEDFSKAPPAPEGPTAHFASGFRGWRYNVAPRGGRWEVADGVFKGTEDPAAQHPATASLGFDFTDVVIECEVRMHDVPVNGRTGRLFMIRTTDKKDYVCSIIFSEAGWRIQKDDNDRAGPDKSVPLGRVSTAVKLGEWQKVVFEILGDEMVCTVNGKSLAGRHAFIRSDKKSLMFVAGVEGGVRRLRIWEALPKPEWPQTRANLTPNG